MPPGVLIESRGLDCARDLCGRRAQRFDLAPIRAALERPVVAHLQHAARAPALVGAERQEDPDQVLVPAFFEHLAGEGEWRSVAAHLFFISDQTGEHMTEHCAIRSHHGHLGPRGRNGYAARDDVRPIPGRKRPDDHRLPGLRDVHEHVILGQGPVLLERPTRDPRVRLP